MSSTLRIGTRGSRLALWQAEHVKKLLEREGQEAELVEISTQGDRDRSLPFSGMSGSGFFTKAIEEALLAEKVDVAVHSHKDLETTATPGTRIAAIPERAEPKDLLLVHPDHYRADPLLPIEKEGLIGSSSPRRQEQIRMFRPDLKVEELRGNVPTRLQKLRDKRYGAILIAKAGIDRLEEDVSDLESFPLPPERFIPAPAQGALAIQIREGDEASERIVRKLHDPSSAQRCNIERGVLQRFRGGCQLPLGAYCQEERGGARVWCMVLNEGSDMPRRLEMHVPGGEDRAAERIAQTLQSSEERSVFISKDLGRDHWWVRTLEGNGQSVTASALIEQEALDVDKIPDIPTVFFSSRNGVRYFMEKEQDHKHRSFGVYSSGSAEALAEYGYEAEFIGKGEPRAVASSLLEWLRQKNESRILLPGPETPSGNISRFLEEASGIEVHELPVYRTIHKKNPSLPQGNDTLIFTSPSNVEAFAELGGSIENEEVLIIGPSTQATLQERFPEVSSHRPKEPGLLGLLDLYFARLSV